MDNTPASPGEPLLPRISSAEWFNSTLRSNPQKQGERVRQQALREGEILCIPKASSETRFKPVGLSDFGNTEDYDIRTPYVSEDDVDEFNWVIPQESLMEGAGVVCVVSGLTRAWVTTTISTDTSVIYDTTTQTLITAREGKAQILIKGDTSFPSLINIGNQCNVVEALGYLGAALTGTTDTVSITDLVGVNFPATELSTSVTARNVFAWTADVGALALIRWVHGLQQWIIIQVTCPGDTVYTLP